MNRDRDPFSTPLNNPRYAIDAFPIRSTATKRDSLTAELERDPQLSTAKRQQRTQAFTSNMAHASLERQLAAAHTTRMELETKVRERDLAVERLERDRRWFADREKEEREEKERERTERDEEKRKTDGELRSARSALTALREEHADLEDAHASLSRSTAHTLASQKSEISTLTRQCTVLEEEVAQLKLMAEERSGTIRDLQEQVDELSVVRGGTEVEEERHDMGVVREELHRQAGYLRTLEAANARLSAEVRVLREQRVSVEVVREEKRGLERRMGGFEEMRERVVGLEAEVEAGRREREEWASKVSAAATSPSNTPVSVTHSLSELRLAHARLLEEHGANVALLHRREAEIVDADRRDAEAREAVEKLEMSVRSLKEKIQRRDHRVMLADREVGFLQALVASFTAEEANQEGMHVDEAKDRRVQELEMLLQEYKTTNFHLTKEMDALAEDSVSFSQGPAQQSLSAEVEVQRAAKMEAQQALEVVEGEARRHLEKIEELEQSLFELGGEIGGGRHVPPGVRVLSLRDNPEQQWVDLRQAAMDRLKGENEALMNRLKELEERGVVGEVNGRAGEELVPRESWELVSKEKNELEEVVRQKEKRLLRLQQVFTSKSAEFREAIASILGLKLAFYPNGQVRVTSMYDLCASFVFQPTSKTEGAKMQLVAQGEGGPQDLPEMMRFWIEREQCTPGFLASVTLECYEKSKREGGQTGG